LIVQTEPWATLPFFPLLPTSAIPNKDASSLSVSPALVVAHSTLTSARARYMSYRHLPSAPPTTAPAYSFAPSKSPATHHAHAHPQQPSLAGQDDPAAPAPAAPSPTMRKRQRTALDMANPAVADPQQANQQPHPSHLPQQALPQPGVAEDRFIADQDAAESGGDDDDEEEKPKDKKAGRRKIKIEFIQDKSRRHITFSKRKAGTRSSSFSPFGSLSENAASLSQA